ncbi:MAG TPA: hypothetical protein VHP33_37070 [Polyangiaceae bacterium]|nr:hypothetical protein [Polyangiaceae bacterium]
MRWARLVMIGAVGFAARGASAQPLGFEWRGPGCRDFQPAFEARLAQLVDPADRGHLAGAVTVSPVGNRFDVRLEVSLGGKALGERRFEAADCPGAANIAAVGAAMAAFSSASRAPDPAPTVSAPPEPAASSPLAAAPAPEASGEQTPSSSSWRAQPRLGVLGTAQAGVLPDVAWGVALELGVGLGRRWSFAVLGSISLEQARDIDAERRALLRSFSGVARGCFAPLLYQRLQLDACGGVQLLWVHGEGSGFDANHSASLFAAAPLVGLGFSLRAPELVEWRAELEGFVPLSRRRFLVDGQQVARASALGVTARLGPVLRF